jgi:WD40 repeat protein
MIALTVRGSNPFPGLRPFMQDEADLFFGRDGQSDELVRRLAARRFLAVVGTSGSGKSSLVRAGLLPSLEGGLMPSAGTHWRIAVLRPQDDPIGFLARAIAETNPLANLDLPKAAAAGVIETTLRRSSLGLVEAVRLARLEPHENLLVLVDQFEELFRFADLAAERDAGNEAPAFVKLLLAAVQQTAVPIYVVITMRSDFLGDCARFRDFPEAISDSQYLIPRLTRDELHAVITGPIGVRGGRIAPGLVQRLLNDVGDDSDQLPILQHALMRAWDHWERHDPDDRAIDLADLQAIGGMSEALSKHADEAFASLTEWQHTMCARMFKCLTERGPDNREIRRPTPLGRLATITNADVADVVDVIDVFRAPGRSFLMPPPSDMPLADDSVIDISHESLIRQWRRLRTWVDDEAESRATYRRLVEAARLRRAGRGGLWGEPDLTYARQWEERDAPNAAWAEQYGAGFDEACAFLRDSARAHAEEIETERQRAEAERMAKERELEQARALAETQRQRAEEQAAATARQRRLIWALCALLALAAAMAAFAWQQRGSAEAKRREAEYQSGLALSRQLAARAVEAFERGPGLRHALMLAGAAYRVSPTADARQILRRMLGAQPQLRTFLSGGSPVVTILSEQIGNVRAIAFSPDGKTLASANDDNTIVLWDVASRTPLGEPLKAHAATVNSVAFSPDGRTLATASSDATVMLWDATRRVPVGVPMKGHQSFVSSVVFSPDGKTLASAGEDRTIVLWDVASGKPVGKPLEHPARVESVAFSPDGKMLASSGGDDTVILWDVTRREAMGEALRGNGNIVESVAFSPDGKTLASVGQYGSLILRDVASRTPLGDPLNGVRSVAFSPEGRTLAVGRDDGTIVLLDASSRRALGAPLKGHPSKVLSLSFSPDGKTLASAGGDFTVILWEAKPRKPLGVPLTGHQGFVNAVAVSADGRMFASAGSDGTVIVWDENRREALKLLKGHRDTVWNVAFSPDGKTVASASSDKTVILWDIANGRPLSEPLGDHRDTVTAVAFSPDGWLLASGSSDRTAILWDVASRMPLGTLSGHEDTVWNVAFSPDGKTLATASSDQSVRFWDVTSRAPLGKPLSDHGDPVYGLAFSPDGKVLASSSADVSVQFVFGQAGAGVTAILWDVASRTRIGAPLAMSLTSLQTASTSVAFSPDGRTLAITRDDNERSVMLWDVASRKPLGDPILGAGKSVFSADGKTLVSGGQDGTVTLWDVDVSSWLRKVCAIANRNLTHAEWTTYVGDDVPYRVACPEFAVLAK